MKFLANLLQKFTLVLSQHGIAYVVMEKEHENKTVLKIGDKQLNNTIRHLAHQEGVNSHKLDLKDINEDLIAQAEMSGKEQAVYSRVAPIDGGIELDMCDSANTRIRITAGKVEIVTHGSETLFYRNRSSLPMVMPQDKGDLNLLKKYLNLSPTDFMLFTAWLSYTLAHPKVSTSKYVILVLQGDQGTGKTFICSSVIIKLLDPSRVGVQVFPKNAKDLTIAGQHSQVLCYDNMRNFKTEMADILCMTSTGGVITARALYTDADQHINHLHVPLVLNGIHSFINQADLAQRCLSIRTMAMTRATSFDFLKSFIDQ